MNTTVDNKDLDFVQAEELERIAARRGATLVEVLMYLGIAAFIIGGAIVLYSLATASSRANNAITEVMTIVDQVHSLYNGQSSYDGLSNTDLAQTGEFPSKWIKNGNIVTPYGNIVTVVAGTEDGGTNTINITFPSIPKDACIKLATNDFGNGLLLRTPAGGSSASASSASNKNGVPLTVAEANAGCQSGGTTMQFNFE